MSSLTEKLKEHGQQEMVQWLEALEGERRERLAAELEALEMRTVKLLRQKLESVDEAPEIDELQPAPVIRLPRTAEEAAAEQSVVELGKQIIGDDQVALLVVAGGQGTRLGYSGPKGTLPITPITGKSLFQHHAEKILAARRRYSAALPWFIMTSPDNDQATRDFFAENDFFGLGEATVHFFMQGTLPILNPEGQMLLKPDCTLLTGPDGHGGVIKALERSGMAAEMERHRCRYISYFQVDNPLVDIIDARYIGYHVRSDSQFSSKVVARRDAGEGLGLAVLADGEPKVLEYVDIRNSPDLQEQTSQTDEAGNLVFSFGSIAIHVIDVELVRRLASGEQRLPLHPSAKKYEALQRPGDPDSAAKTDCYKFERFVFDAIEHSGNAIFVETDRAEEFAPVKRAGTVEDEDTPDRARRMMMEQWGRWLERCGVDVFESAGGERKLTEEVEISPLFALDIDALSDKLVSGKRVKVGQGKILLI